MQLLLYIVVMGLLFWYDWVRIARWGGEAGEKLAFAALMLVAFGLGAAMLFQLPVPNPTRALQMVFQPLSIPFVPD